MTKTKSVQRRGFERIPSSLVVKYVHDDALCYGIVENISEKGMCINSGTYFPLDTRIDLHVPLKATSIDLPVVVKWARQTEGFYDIMGVELLATSGKYLHMLNNIRSSLVTV